RHTRSKRDWSSDVCSSDLSQGWKLEVMDANITGIGGYKEVIMMITGDKVYSKLKYESGAHRVQRVPETESQGRVHTSTATVVVKIGRASCRERVWITVVGG